MMQKINKLKMALGKEVIKKNEVDSDAKWAMIQLKQMKWKLLIPKSGKKPKKARYRQLYLSASPLKLRPLHGQD